MEAEGGESQTEIKLPVRLGVNLKVRTHKSSANMKHVSLYIMLFGNSQCFTSFWYSENHPSLHIIYHICSDLVVSEDFL